MPKDKESTKKKLIAAVADILSTEGYHGLGVNKAARMLGVEKKLIDRYFGNISQNGDQVRRLLTSVLH
jgi:AcrR family transcriptional regulator